MPNPSTPRAALALLAELGAVPWLVRHHELVLEAATILCERLRCDLGVVFDRELVLLGAALHDAGKIVHADEMRAPGNQHELAGRDLLTSHGVEAGLARFCVTHAAWDRHAVALEDLLVALADKLWKGKREAALEDRIAGAIATATQLERWVIFDALDSICEAIAADGVDRLARSDA